MSRLDYYQTHDNGGRPYRVEYDSTHFSIYSLTPESKEETLVLNGVYEKKWIGDNILNDPHYAPREQEKGNSLLLRDRSGKYLFIGHRVILFDVGDDEIIDYYSPVGNNDVPYPYAVGRKYMYFLLDNKRVLVEHMNLERDGYTQFYSEIPQSQKKPFRVKRIHTPEY